MGTGLSSHLRAAAPIALFSLIFLVAGSAVQKMAIGVPLTPRGFIFPALSGGILGILLGIWMARDRAKHRKILERSRRIDVLNAEILRRETELQTLLADKEILLAEVHHRVRNLLQLLSSIVALEESLCENGRRDPERAARCFRRRIESISVVYDQLIDPTRSLDIRVIDLTAALAARYGFVPGAGDSFPVIEVDDCTLPIGQSIPLSLVLDELFDAMVHRDRETPPSIRISVDAAYCHVRYRLGTVDCRNGSDGPCRETIRIGLFRALAAQLNGSIDHVAHDSVLRALDLTFPLIGGVTIDPFS